MSASVFEASSAVAEIPRGSTLLDPTHQSPDTTHALPLTKSLSVNSLYGKFSLTEGKFATVSEDCLHQYSRVASEFSLKKLQQFISESFHWLSESLQLSTLIVLIEDYLVAV